MDDSQMVIVNGQQATNGDETLFVKFYMNSIQSSFETEKQGRPIFVPKLFVSIMAPGSNLSRVDRPATDADKQRFPKQWMSYQNNENCETTGTPIAEWPKLTRTQVDELRAMKFYSVEQLAAASDAQLNAVGPMGPNFRTMAIAYLAQAKDTAAAQKIAAENERLTNDNVELKAQVKALADRLDAIESGTVTTRPRGRPRKVLTV